MSSEPEQWAVDVEYLAKLADWAAGQGFCEIDGLEDPDEWCALKWDALVPEANGTGYGYSAQALAGGLIASIQRAFEERERELRDALKPFVFAAENAPKIGKRPHDFVLTSEFNNARQAFKETPDAQ